MTGPSPFVRRRWLGQEIRRLRAEHDMSAEQLARALGFPRQQLSALENGHRGPDIDLVDGICDYLRVGAKRREEIIAAATDGWAIGWWEPDAAKMGHRQARYADLESGTQSISEYALALIPGLLQTPEFTDARNRADPARQPDTFDPMTSVRARTRRQQLLLAPSGPVYDLVLDEIAVRRCAAEPPIVAAQLRHIADLCATHQNISVRVLPVDAAIKGHSAPRSAYSLYRYRDANATFAVAVDTLTSDLVLTMPDEVDAYRQLHSRLKVVTLTPEASLRMLQDVAEQLGRKEGAP
ncbi:helix-turn-helix transcriptional regulator [Plantactinospora mayteni]|uniref:Transcriptional regulator n=1 Tax=Plantactinospora mayteni TaxID=566021 RepID=A0ABQ4EIH4_9ACTN|nr:helix-turn-helix transcriptional regulator [Plantactinospora mayteni]GIG94541.1 transcriptional regulator [Plantactinospora mayteni]